MTIFHRWDLDDSTDTGQFEPMDGIDGSEDFKHVLTNTNADAFEDEELARRAFDAGHDLYTFVDPYVEEKSGQRVLVVNLSEKLAQTDFEERLSLLSQAYKDGSIRRRPGWE
jgi:hypothetical protein